MNFVILLIVACAFSAVAAKAIKAVPWLWYGIALALDAAYAYGIAYSLPPAILQVLSIVVQRGTFAAALFVVVMYVGVFSERSWVRRTIGPVRAELSIIACILAFAHALNYLSSIASGIVFASYYVLRLARYFADKKERASGTAFGSSMKGGGGAQDGTA